MIELIQTNKNNRIYQLDFSVSVFGKNQTIKDLWIADPIKMIDGYMIDEDVTNSINKVCVSDSLRHIERLTFPVFWARNMDTGERKLQWRCNNICGYNTFLIFGGDPKYVYPDMVYIRKLRMKNRKGGKK